MEQQPEFAVIAQGDMQHLRDVQRELKAQGLAARMIPPTEGCGSS